MFCSSLGGIGFVKYQVVIEGRNNILMQRQKLEFLLVLSILPPVFSLPGLCSLLNSLAVCGRRKIRKSTLQISWKWFVTLQISLCGLKSECSAVAWTTFTLDILGVCWFISAKSSLDFPTRTYVRCDDINSCLRFWRESQNLHAGWVFVENFDLITQEVSGFISQCFSNPIFWSGASWKQRTLRSEWLCWAGS